MKTKEGKTALHYSAWRGHTEATSLLLQNGGSVSIIEDVRNQSELFSDYFLFLSHELNDTFEIMASYRYMDTSHFIMPVQRIRI